MGFPGFQLLRCGCVKEMVLEATLFVDVPLSDGWAQVLVSGKDYEVWVLFEQCQ